MARQTKVTKSDKITPLCEVVDIPSGALPKNVIVELPQADGARVLARHDGTISNLTVGDFVELGRRGSDKIYRIVGTDGATVNKASYPYTILTVDKSGLADYDNITDALAAASSGNVVIIGPGEYSEILDFDVDDLIVFGFENTIIKTTTANTILAELTGTGIVINDVTFEHAATTGTNTVVKNSADGNRLQNCLIKATGAATSNTGIHSIQDFESVYNRILITAGTARVGIQMDTNAQLFQLRQGFIDATTEVVVNHASAQILIVGTEMAGDITTTAGAATGYFLDKTTGEIHQPSNGIFLDENGYFDIEEFGTGLWPATPGADRWRLFADPDGLKQMDDAGTIKLLASNAVGPNLMYHSLSYNIYPDLVSAAKADIADDTYVSIWNHVNNGQAPDITIESSNGEAPYGLRATADSANTLFGWIHFFDNEYTRANLINRVMSLSFEALGDDATNNIRAAIIYRDGTGDALTSDVVGTWTSGSNPTLATDWAYVAAPDSTIVITDDYARYGPGISYLQGVTIPDTAQNVGVFIWTHDNQASGDWVQLSAAKFEPGEVSTAFCARPKSEELALTQKFHYVYPQTRGLYGVRQATTVVRSFVQFPVQMRAAPTLVHNISAWEDDGGPETTEIAGVNWSAGVFITISGALTMAIDGAGVMNTTLYAAAGTSFSGGVAGNTTEMILGPTAIVQFDARL